MDIGLGDGIVSACLLESAQADRTMKVNNIVRQIWCFMSVLLPELFSQDRDAEVGELVDRHVHTSTVRCLKGY